MTTGYREGLSVGKARVMQSAFDQGYPIGVELALRAGRIIGVLEGVVAANGEERTLKGLLDRARRELDVRNLMEGVGEVDVVRAVGTEGLGGVEEVVRGWEVMVLGGLNEVGGEVVVTEEKKQGS